VTEVDDGIQYVHPLPPPAGDKKYLLGVHIRDFSLIIDFFQPYVIYNTNQKTIDVYRRAKR
jgi:hypothetical protein